MGFRLNYTAGHRISNAFCPIDFDFISQSVYTPIQNELLPEEVDVLLHSSSDKLKTARHVRCALPPTAIWRY